MTRTWTSGPRRLGALVAIVVVVILAVGSTADAALRVTIRPGDTLSAIGSRYAVSPARLAAHNGIPDGNLIMAGRTLSIPGRVGVSAGLSGGVYTVRAGDTLSAIAGRTGTSVQTLARANGLSNAHLIVTGTRLRIGSGSGSGAPAATWIGGTAYTVRAGDNLSSIAARFGTSAGALARLNGIANPDVLRAGQRLRVGAGSVQPATPLAGATHTVRSGETLSAIAGRYGTTTQRLVALNGLRNPNALAVGMRLRVPSSSDVVMSSGPLTPVTAATSGWGNHPSKDTISSLIAQHAGRYGVDPALVRAVGWQESGWWQGARSSTGAIGVMQLMPGTAAWIGPALVGRPIDPYSASDNIEGGVAYLAYLQRQSGSRRLAIAAYYQGLGSVTAQGLLPETESYVGSVTSFIGRV